MIPFLCKSAFSGTEDCMASSVEGEKTRRASRSRLGTSEMHHRPRGFPFHLRGVWSHAVLPVVDFLRPAALETLFFSLFFSFLFSLSSPVRHFAFRPVFFSMSLSWFIGLGWFLVSPRLAGDELHIPILKQTVSLFLCFWLVDPCASYRRS